MMKKIAVLFLVLLFLLNLIKFFNYFVEGKERELQIEYFDVGQADSSLISLPDSYFQILVDAGDYGDVSLRSKIDKSMPINDNMIEMIILSHGHKDHCNGLLSIIEKYEIGVLVISGAIFEEPEYLDVLEKAREVGIKTVYAVRGLRIDFESNLEINFLHPFYSKNLLYNNPNNASIVFSLNHEGDKYLFTGDVEKEAEKEIISYIKKRDKLNMSGINVLKVSHHGSKSSSNDDFLSLINPDKAVISSGKGNQFGHPHYETIERLLVHKTIVSRTDLEGDIVIKN